jgi:tetratricopeptide (TPR) repeat protein
MLVAQASHARLQLAPPPEDTATRAKAAVSAGREAASRRDFTTALERFEEALALRPAASLHFNIAVCHHNLMLAAAPGDEVYESHRRAAIESYGRYLDASPDAEDRASIEATMKELEELGGRPEAEDEWVIERLDPDDVPVAPALRDAAEPAPPAQTEPRPPPGAATPGATPPESLPLTGRLGPFVPLTLASLVELSESDEAAAAGVPAMRALPASRSAASCGPPASRSRRARDPCSCRVRSRPRSSTATPSSAAAWRSAPEVRSASRCRPFATPATPHLRAPCPSAVP